jgi:MFS family permease
VGRISRAFQDSLRAFQRAFANPGLRRLQLAWAGSNLGAWTGGIAFAVYAYGQDGAFAVGLIALVRTLAAGLAAPFLGTLGDRYSRVRVMVLSDLARAAAIGAMAMIVLADGPSLAVYALAVGSTVAGTAFRPAQAALVPSLARTPEELTASNVTASTVEGVGIFAGPALGGLLLAFTTVEVVLVVTASLFLLSALLVVRVRDESEREAGEEEPSFLRETLAGFSLLARDARLAVLVGLFAAQTFVDGALGVLTVLLALEALGTGATGLGLLNSASGIGGLVGAVVAGMLVARGRLASDFGLGMVLWGAPLLLVAAWLNPLVALAALVLVGVGNTIVDVAGDTLLQRAVPDAVLARVFAIMESLMLVTVGLGSVAAPALEAAFGIRWALVVTGALLPVLTLLAWRVLARIDRDAQVPTREIELLRALPMFAPLPQATLEYLAGKLERRRVAGGETVFRQGDRGDAFYVVTNGTVGVSVDGGAPRELGAGDFFGEIALLDRGPRTATVTAEEPSRLMVIGHREFHSLMEEFPEVAAQVMNALAHRIRRLEPDAPH